MKGFRFRRPPREVQFQANNGRVIMWLHMPCTSLVWPQGLASLRMLWALQERTGRRMHELFDLVCGTSTGGILAAALAIRCVSLQECEEIYRCNHLASCAASCSRFMPVSFGCSIALVVHV